MVFENVVDGLIEINKNNRQIFAEHKDLYSPLHWAMELCTVCCDVGRGVGKTTYINNRAMDDDIIVVDHYHQKKLYKKFRNVFTVDEIVQGLKLRGMDYSNVYVDDASFIFEHHNKVDFYTEVIRSWKDHTFILLG